MEILQIPRSAFENLFQTPIPQSLPFPDVLQYLLYVKAHQPALGSFNSQAGTSVDKWLSSNQVCRSFQDQERRL